MKYFSFSNGDKVPAVGLGTWRASDSDAVKAIRSAIELGYRHFDCAHLYQNETEIGKALKEAVQAGDVRREELFITSKLWNNAHRSQEVQPAIEQTLKSLQIGYLDLFLIHWPIAWKKEFFAPQRREDFYAPGEIPLAETWEAMLQIREKNLCRHAGVSNFNMLQLKDIIGLTGEVPEMNQLESHPYLAQDLMKDYAENHGILLTAYKPLGSGGKQTDEMKRRHIPGLFSHPIIRQVADEQNATPSQVILAWQINRGFCVIPKSTNAERQAENLKAATIELTPEQMAHINGLDSGIRFVDGAGFTQNGSPYTQDYIWGNL